MMNALRKHVMGVPKLIVSRLATITAPQDWQSKKWQALRAAVQVCNTHSIPYWLSDGAVLGYLRTGDLLVHDRDLDFGIKIADYTPAIREHFLKAGWQLTRIHGTPERGYQEALRFNGVKLDLFYFYEEPDYWWHAAWDHEKMLRYRYTPFTVAPRDFKGLLINMPTDVEAYVLTKYGPAWRTPVTPWDWRTSPVNYIKE